MFTSRMLNERQRIVVQIGTILFVLITTNLFAIQNANAQTIRYVKSDGSGSGTGSWSNASNNLQAMITASASGDQVWVMKGNYQPAVNGSFTMANGVKIYGSFAGTEVNLSDRVIGSTSADSSRLIGNGTNVIVNNQNGLDATALLDGFFITGGNATQGGGMYNRGASPTINHCIFFKNNAAGNSSSTNGGGMYNFQASPAISYCIFSNNTATTSGNGEGGGIYNEQASPAINSCIFSGNSVSGIVSYGGGAFYYNCPSPLNLSNSIFLNNSAGRGGGVYNGQASLNVVNCSFAGNAGRGAGILVENSSSGAPTVINCIIWGNSEGIYNAASITAAVSNSIVQGGYAGAGNLNINPLFIDPTTGDLRLQSSSPAINTGSTAAVPVGVTTDLAGNPRVYNTIVDMGAYEYQGAFTAPQLPNGNRTLTMPLSPNTTGTFLADANGLITTIASDGSATAITGNVTAKVWVESAVPSYNGQPYVARHYEITPPASNATATMTLYYSQLDFTDFNNAPGSTLKLPVNSADIEGYKANLRIAKYSLTSSDGTGLMGTYHNGVTIINPDDANIIWNGNYWAVSFPVSGFSGFFAQTSQTALPVKWISSNAQLNSLGHALISWKVQEQNVSGYEVQKSNDGISFTTIGSIHSSGDGENNYSFTETGILTNTAFYRVKQTDKDGQISYSSVLKLQSNYSGKTTVSLYPNPVNETSVININSPVAGKVQYRLTDNSGKTLQQNSMQLNAGNTIIHFNTSNYPAGIYYLNIKGETINQQIKIVK